jgi:uncharacterized protein (DUF2147 family)
MPTMMRTLFTAALAASVLLGGAQWTAAEDKGAAIDYYETVVGTWQPPDKLSDYEIRVCNTKSGAICLKVKALRGDAVKPKYTAYLGKDIVENAKPAGKGKWKGKLHLFGQEADGTLTIKDANTLNLEGCAFVVICDDVVLKRVSQ